MVQAWSRRFPGGWPRQKRAIRFVRELYQKEKELPKDLAKLAAADPELKKDLKQVMNFVAVLREQLAKFGDVVFQETPRRSPPSPPP